MTNGDKNVNGIFVVDNKEATVNAINNIKKIINITLKQIQNLSEEKNSKSSPNQLCEDIIKNLYLLIDTIDKKRQTSISKDLDYLYKHCLFSVLRVRDDKDFEFLDGCIQILKDITEGWDRVGSAMQKAPAFG